MSGYSDLAAVNRLCASLQRLLAPTVLVNRDRMNTDPFYMLPYELWVKCIRFYAYEQPEGPLPLLGVSPEWQERLLESPALWTTIHFDGGHDEDCRAECFFHLSRSSAVTLIVGQAPGTMQGAIKYRDRISSILFWNATGPLYADSTFSSHSQKLDGLWYSNLIYLHAPREDIEFLAWNPYNACSTLAELVKPRVTQMENKEDALTAVSNLAAIYYLQDRYQESEDLALEVLDQRRLLGESHPDTIIAMSTLALVYVAQRDIQKSETLLRSMLTVAESYRSDRFRHEAEELGLDIWHHLKSVLGTDHPLTIVAMIHLSKAYRDKGQYKKEELLEKEVLYLRRKLDGKNDMNSHIAATSLTITYIAQEKYGEAELLLLETLEIDRKRSGEPQHVRPMVLLAFVYSIQNKWDLARPLLSRAVFYGQEAWGDNFPQTQNYTSRLSYILGESGFDEFHINHILSGISQRVKQAGTKQ